MESPRSLAASCATWVRRFSGCKATLPGTRSTASTSLRTKRWFASTPSRAAFQQTACPRSRRSSTRPRRSNALLDSSTRLALAIALGLASTSSAQAPEGAQLPSVTLPPPLARVLTDYEAAWRNKDAAALAALFWEDGFVLSSGVPPVRGRGRIQKHYAGQGGPLALRALAFATEGSVGYIIGGFSRQKGEADIGKFTLTLRRGADERWLIMSDMDNGNSRP